MYILVVTSVHIHGCMLYNTVDTVLSLLAHVGLKLATVYDVMQLNPLPKVICSLQAWKGDDDKSSVEANELLVLKQVCL